MNFFFSICILENCWNKLASTTNKFVRIFQKLLEEISSYIKLEDSSSEKVSIFISTPFSPPPPLLVQTPTLSKYEHILYNVYQKRNCKIALSQTEDVGINLFLSLSYKKISFVNITSFLQNQCSSCKNGTSKTKNFY